MRLIPKNWSEFQHYKDRMPPWIKLHKSLLDDRDYMTLPADSKALAPLLWLLASENKDGVFNADLEELSFRLRMTVKEIDKGLKPLLEKGFFLDASTMLAISVHVAVPETETETETEKKAKNKSAIKKPDLVTDQTWSDFLTHRKNKKATVTQTVLSAFEKQAELAGIPLEEALKECIARGWTGFKAEWVKSKQNESSKYEALN